MLIKTSLLAVFLLATLSGCNKRTPEATQTVAVQSDSMPNHPESFDFKGVTIGHAATRQLLLDQLALECPKGKSPDFVCSGNNQTISGHDAYMTAVVREDGLLHELDLLVDGSAVDDVVRALALKFGKPLQFESDAQRRAWTWHASNNTRLLVVKYDYQDKADVNFETLVEIDRKSTESGKRAVTREVKKLRDL